MGVEETQKCKQAFNPFKMPGSRDEITVGNLTFCQREESFIATIGAG